MKNYIVLIVTLLLTSLTSAQHLYIESGKAMSSFEYHDSSGNELNNMHSVNQLYMAAGYQNHLFGNKLTFNIGLDYAGYGALNSDQLSDTYLAYNVNYLGLNMGLSYQLFSIKKATLYMKGTISGAVLTQGTQTYNNQVFDLMDNEDFDNPLIYFRGGGGISHPISENLSFYVQFLTGKSLNISSSNEELKIVGNILSFGLLVKIKNPIIESTKK